MKKYNKSRIKDPRLRRLATEHEKIEELCSRSEKMSYKIKKRIGNNPPERYEIVYKVRSITSIDDKKMPQYGTFHIAEVDFPSNYPSKEAAPRCYMRTPIWHPNIKSSGPYKGRICVQQKALGSWHWLDDLAIRIGEILQYKNYHAENIAPYPEDEKVAAWVRDIAEPKGIISKDELTGPIDPTPLLDPVDVFPIPDKKEKKTKAEKELHKPTKKKSGLKIKNIRKRDDLQSPLKINSSIKIGKKRPRK